jgi:hypothetical protein
MCGKPWLAYLLKLTHVILQGEEKNHGLFYRKLNCLISSEMSSQNNQFSAICSLFRLQIDVISSNENSNKQLVHSNHENKLKMEYTTQKNCLFFITTFVLHVQLKLAIACSSCTKFMLHIHREECKYVLLTRTIIILRSFL